MQQLSELIARREDWLVNRTIHYAKLHGYTPFTSTLTEAWRTAICGMSAPLIAALAEYSEPPQLTAAADYADDSITAFGIQVARRHRSRGITLGLCLGLMKYYRQSYLDLLDLGELPEADLPRYREFRLLEHLMRHAGQVVTRTMLLEKVWDYHFDPQTNVIDVHVSRLRQKLDKGFDKPLIHTVRNAGYMIRAEG